MAQQIGLNFKQSPYMFEALKKAVDDEYSLITRHPDELIELELPDGTYYVTVGEAFRLYEALDEKDGAKDDVLNIQQYEDRVMEGRTTVPPFGYVSFTPSGEFKALECFFKNHKLYYSVNKECLPTMALHNDPDPTSVKDVLLSVFYMGWRAGHLETSARAFTRADESEFMFLYNYNAGCAYASGLFARVSWTRPDFYRIVNTDKVSIIVQNLSKHAEEVRSEDIPTFLAHEGAHLDLLNMFKAGNPAITPIADGVTVIDPREKARSLWACLAQRTQADFGKLFNYCGNNIKDTERFFDLVEESMVWGYVSRLKPEDTVRVLTRQERGDLEEFWSYGIKQQPASVVVTMAWYASIAEKLGIKYTDGVPIADKYRQQLELWPQVKDNFDFLISLYNQAFDMLPNDEQFANFAKDKLAR